MRAMLPVAFLASLVTLLIAGSAYVENAPAPEIVLTPAEVDAVKTELEDRSFRQFEPRVDANPRKGAILDFSGPLTLWAQYWDDPHVLEEWEITAGDYSVERAGSGRAVTLHLIAPQTRRELPTRCRDCIDAGGVSISARNVFDAHRIEFRVNDPDGVLPSPFLVFTRWTEFREDVRHYQDLRRGMEREPDSRQANGAVIPMMLTRDSDPGP